MWKGTKKIISSNNSNHTFPTAITVNNETITNPSSIGKAFNNYFVKVVRNIQSFIRFSKKKYFDYIPLLNIESFFITEVLKFQTLSRVVLVHDTRSNDSQSNDALFMHKLYINYIS